MDASDEKPMLKDLNEHIVCPLCRGYLIDATTLVECLHSFCRGCIVRRLSGGPRVCPVCNAATLPPLIHDVRLQRLVYLVVPGLFRSEQERRRHFRLVNPQCSPVVPPSGAPDLTFDDLVSLSLCELTTTRTNDTEQNEANNPSNVTRLNIKITRNSSAGPEVVAEEKGEYEITNENKRYLKCPAGVTVRHLLRLLMLKRGWNDTDGQVSTINKIEMMYEVNGDEPVKEMHVLDPSWTLLDLACIFEWKREAPMKLLYRIVIKEDLPLVSKIQTFCEEVDSNNSREVIENIQRPPTPPPSPKLILRSDPPTCPLENISRPPTTSPAVECNKESETKKPRCEVTPVMRAPDPVNNNNHDSRKSGKIAKLEHHKRKKRRNKRVIAEITTTPHEDLLKLKVRLTPCPPRNTSNASNQSKEKVIQVRAVKKEKAKTNSVTQQSQNNNNTGEDEATKTNKEQPSERDDEETIEDIIDSIPDEIIEIAQAQKLIPEIKSVSTKKSEKEETPKDEEVLRRLGLVAISEADKAKRETPRTPQINAEKTENMDREKLEKQLRDSKANRVRSLLAEKSMRDADCALKNMSNNAKESATPGGSSTTPNPHKRKGPPPLAPLRSTKRSIVTFASNSYPPKYESPLDLSGGGTCNNVLDLSSTVGETSTKCTKSRPSIRSNVPGLIEKPKEERKTHDSNLRTLSEAAVSLLGDRVIEKVPAGQNYASGATNVGSKVALRIPQPQRISGFGMKPNMGVRHIPNPQAVVASQYRHQRARYFNVPHQPP